MNPAMVKRFSDLGDPVLLLLAALAMFFYLWIDDDRRRMAGPWALSMGLCIGLVFSSKLLLHLFGRTELSPFRMFSPSGHVAIATTFYGNLGFLLARGRSRQFSAILFAGTSLLIALLAASRMVLRLHSLPEIAIALAIGLAALGPFRAALARRSITIRVGQPIALLSLLAVVRVSHIDGEALVVYFARTVASVADRPVVTTATRASGMGGE